jgi:hypothetical protein
MGKKHLQLAIVNAVHQQSDADTRHEPGPAMNQFISLLLGLPCLDLDLLHFLSQIR